MRIFATAAAAALMAGMAAPALAQTADAWAFQGIYGNLGGSLNNTQGTTSKNITGRVGGRFGRYLGVEGELTAGLDGGSRTFAGGTPAQREIGVKQQFGGAAYVVGFLPLRPNIDLLARVGYGASKYDISPSGLNSYHVNEHGLRYGAGMQAFFDPKNGVRFDYTRVNMNNYNDAGGFFSPGDKKANVWSLSYVRRF